ncbi:MAG TPA: VIT1/CCC1 transporter family protein [Fibrobacteria bacterium]|nr:VIT1/CCC1 transporter family protein [Fibrobacteria bacterium]
MDESGRLSRLRREHTSAAVQRRLARPRRPSLLRDAVLGAVDGCVTTFAVVAGAVGGGLSDRTILILGGSNLLADGFSMAASNYLGARSLTEEIEFARSREVDHIRLIPEGEKEEVRQIFAAKGFHGDLLEQVVAILTSDKEVWLRTMLDEELGLGKASPRPVLSGAATFLAFCLAGVIPLSTFLFPGLAKDAAFPLSCLGAAMTFLAVGGIKGLLVGKPILASGAATLGLGGVAAALAYVTGNALDALLR